MKTHSSLTIHRSLVVLATVCAALTTPCKGRMFSLPPENPTVEKAMTAEHLQSVADSTNDPEVWLGLSLFPHPGDPIRKKLLDRAVESRSELAPVAAVIANAMDGVDEHSVNELIEQDAGNALGYYLLGVRHYQLENEAEALKAFQTAAGCARLQVHGETIATALFKALDALNLEGQNRLCASSWIATRWTNFEGSNFQSQRTLLRRLARDRDLERQTVIGDLMLTLAGHLIGSDLIMGRTFGERALVAAFHLKADVAAAENSPTMIGYAGAVQALVSTKVNAAGFQKLDPLQYAPLLPGRVWAATLIADPNDSRLLRETESKVSEANRTEFERAREATIQASVALVNAALPNQDEVIGAYFRGHLPKPTNAPAPWFINRTYVDQLMANRPELFAAFEIYENARGSLTRIGRRGSSTNHAEASTPDSPEDLKNRCIYNLRRIDGAKQQWAIVMNKQPGDAPRWPDLTGDFLREIPECPSGGTYSLGSITEKPSCTVEGHLCP